MASTSCFLNHPTLVRSSTLQQRHVQSIKPNQVICRAQKQVVTEEDNALVSRRLALTVLIGAAAVATKVSPADAAYGEAGNPSATHLINSFAIYLVTNYLFLFIFTRNPYNVK